MKKIWRFMPRPPLTTDLLPRSMRRATIFIWLIRPELKVAPPFGVAMEVVKFPSHEADGISR